MRVRLTGHEIGLRALEFQGARCGAGDIERRLGMAAPASATMAAIACSTCAGSHG
jgi:hypothetical protein